MVGRERIDAGLCGITRGPLARVYKPIVALEMPGLFTTWAKLDAARDAMKGEFEKGVRDAGFFIVGWGDSGLAHVFSKGFAVHSPDDFKGKRIVGVGFDRDTLKSAGIEDASALAAVRASPSFPRPLRRSCGRASAAASAISPDGNTSSRSSAKSR